MRKFIRCLIGLVAYLILSPQAGLACSCSNPALEGKSVKQQIAEARERSAVIFSGKVIEVVKSKSPEDEASGEVEIKFDVVKSWKGVKAGQTRVFTAASSSLCGYTFEMGESYLVYAHDFGDGKLETNICTRTKRLAEAVEDLKVLGGDKATDKAENASDTGASRAEQKLIDVDRRWADAGRRNDMVTVRLLTAVNYIGTDPDGKVINRAEAFALMSRERVNSSNLTTREIQARIYGTMGVVIGRMSAQDEPSLAFRFTRVWVKQGGSWKLAASHTHRVAQ